MCACEIWRRRGPMLGGKLAGPRTRTICVRACVIFGDAQININSTLWGALWQARTHARTGTHTRIHIHRAPPSARAKMRECANDMLLLVAGHIANARAVRASVCVLLRREFNGWLSRLLCAQYNVLCRLLGVAVLRRQDIATASFGKSASVMGCNCGSIKSIRTRR